MPTVEKTAMEKTRWQLAQINIAHMIAPIDDPRLADFVAQLTER